MARQRPAPYWSEIDNDPLYRQVPFDRWRARFDFRVMAAQDPEGKIRLSLRELAARWGWSKDQVTRFIKPLVEETYLDVCDSDRDKKCDNYILGKKALTGKGATKNATKSATTNWFDDLFWPAYPKKVAKEAARKAAAALNGINPKVILEGLERCKKGPDWQKDSGKYIPHAATFLNGRRWEDEGPLGSIFGRTTGKSDFGF